MEEKEDYKKDYEIEIEDKKEETKGIKVFKEIVEWCFCIILAVFVALWIRYYIFTSTTVKQLSMSPTLEENQRLILDRTRRITKNKYQKGDIVTLEAPSEIKRDKNVDISNKIAIYNNEPKSLFDKFVYYNLEFTKINFIKRIIAVEGERIQIKNNKVYINGQELEEKYLSEGTITEPVYYNDLVVPKGCVYVMGDNRAGSMDSRLFGCIPVDKVEGKVVFCYLPTRSFGVIK